MDSQEELYALEEELARLERDLAREKGLAAREQAGARGQGIARDRVHVLEEIYRGDIQKKIKEKETKELELRNLIIEEQLIGEEMRFLEYQMQAMGAIRGEAEKEVGGG